MLRSFLLVSFLAAGMPLAHAQIITDAARAIAARDSLLQSAAALQQQIQSQSHHFESKTPWTGKRRQRVRGFAVGASARYTWEQKTVLRRNGTTATRFTALLNGKRVLREQLRNGKLEYVWLKTQPSAGAPTASTTTTAAAAPVPGTYGVYLHGGYLRWNRNQYIVPVPSAPNEIR